MVEKNGTDTRWSLEMVLKKYKKHFAKKSILLQLVGNEGYFDRNTIL